MTWAQWAQTRPRAPGRAGQRPQRRRWGEMGGRNIRGNGPGSRGFPRNSSDNHQKALAALVQSIPRAALAATTWSSRCRRLSSAIVENAIEAALLPCQSAKCRIGGASWSRLRKAEIWLGPIPSAWAHSDRVAPAATALPNSSATSTGESGRVLR